MLRPTLVTLATAIALAAPATTYVAPATAAAPDARAGITGTWKGPVVNQDGPAGYTGTVRLTRSGGKYRATVAYSGGLNRTKWVYEGRKGDWFRFRELPRTSSDVGVGGVEIKVKRVRAHLAVRYLVPGSNYRGSMKARRLR